MKRLILLISLACCSVAHAAFQEFYVQPTGSNLNAGSTATDAATRTYASGSWVASTGVFTLASGNPVSDSVAAGDFASVFADGATQTDFVGRVTAVSSTTITVSLTAKSGTAPTDGTGNRTLKIGGAWAGMSGTNAFPFEWYSGVMNDADGNTNRINFKGVYSITSTIDHVVDGATWYQGYTTTPGDGGKATITGPTTGTYFNLVKLSSSPGDTDSTFADFIIENNGNTGSTTSTHGLWINVAGVNAFRVLARNIGGNGILQQTAGVLVSCEAYNCNLANNVSQAGIAFSGSGSQGWFCISHHNPSSNADGFYIGSSSHALYCISAYNGRHGYNIPSSAGTRSIMQCDAFANGGAGVNVGSAVTGVVVIENTNLVDNGGAGIDLNNSLVTGVIANCGLGSGSVANDGGGIVEVVAAEVLGTVTYDPGELPWVSPSTGNFTINLAAAKNAGRGAFLQTSGGPTVGTPDIGAAQSADGPGNTAPTVTISSPANGASVSSPVTFTGSAGDSEDGTISSSITWNSNVSGALGTGASISPALSAGVHTITASITDAGSLTDTDSISITVTAPPAPDGTLNATSTTTTNLNIQ